MKIAHKKNEKPATIADLLSLGKSLEQDSKLQDAAAAFEKVITQDPFNEFAFNRLMIIHRKLKQYRKEVAVIRKGISNFQKFFRSASRLTVSRRVASLSKSLSQSLGLTDKKGKEIYERQPIGRWRKRLLVAERLAKR